MVWQKDAQLQQRLDKIIKTLKFFHVKSEQVVVFRSYGSTSRAQARIWGFPKIWQQALNLPPYYCLEVLSEKFDKLDNDAQNKVLIHELLHIPKNFSGSLLSHRGRNRRIDRRTIENLFNYLKKHDYNSRR